MRRVRLILIGGLAALLAAPSVAQGAWGHGPYPAPKRLDAAKSFVAERSGSVSFAVIGPDGDARGVGMTTHYSSASVTKALLLAGYLHDHKGRIDASTKGELAAMVTASDNDAANAIYASVGDSGLAEVARRAGMRDFEPTPGFWGGAQITAVDMARFFRHLDRNLAGPHHDYGKHLLASIIESERWGIPQGAGHGWRVWFKGGWRPGGAEENSSGPVSHQAALLRYRNGVEVAICVLSDETPGEGGGYTTIEGIASRLLHPPPPPRRWTPS